ncbi:hypothetical protein ACQV2S_01870 [Facklamia sp. P13064]
MSIFEKEVIDNFKQDNYLNYDISVKINSDQAFFNQSELLPF